MPIPSPEPTAAQIVTVAEIAMVSVEEATTFVSADSDQDVADAKWARTLADITNWADLGSDLGDTKRVDSIEFFEGAVAEGRLSFRNTLRQRYGLGPLLSETTGVGVNIRSLCWF